MYVHTHDNSLQSEGHPFDNRMLHLNAHYVYSIDILGFTIHAIEGSEEKLFNES